MNRLGILLSAILVSIIMMLTAAPSLSVVDDNGHHYAKGHHKHHKNFSKEYRVVPGHTFALETPYGQSKASDNNGDTGRHLGQHKPHKGHRKGHRHHHGHVVPPQGGHIRHHPHRHTTPHHINRHFMHRPSAGQRAPVCVIVEQSPPEVRVVTAHETRTKTETLVRKVLLGTLVSLTLAAIGMLAMFLGYIMGQRDGQKHEDDFVKSLIGFVRGEGLRPNE